MEELWLALLESNTLPLPNLWGMGITHPVAGQRWGTMTVSFTSPYGMRQWQFLLEGGL